MPSIQSEISNIRRELIRKNNLWKFIKRLRAEYQPIFALLCRCPLSIVWIDTNDGTLRLSFSDFINEMSGLPNYPVTYRQHLKTHRCKDDSRGVRVVSAEYRDELTLEVIDREIPHLMAYICREAFLAGEPFEITSQNYKELGILRKYRDWMQSMVARCNERIIEDMKKGRS